MDVGVIDLKRGPKIKVEGSGIFHLPGDLYKCVVWKANILGKGEEWIEEEYAWVCAVIQDLMRKDRETAEIEAEGQMRQET